MENNGHYEVVIRFMTKETAMSAAKRIGYAFDYIGIEVREDVI